MIADITPLIYLNLLFYALFCLLLIEFVKTLRKIHQTENYTMSSLRLRVLLIAILIVFNGVFFGLYHPDGSAVMLKNQVSLVIFLLISYLLMDKVIHTILLDHQATYRGKLSLFIIILVVGSVLFSSQSSTLMNQNENYVRYNPYGSNVAISSDMSSFAWVRTYRDNHYLFLETFKDNTLKKDIVPLDETICPKLEKTNIACKVFFSDEYDFYNRLTLMFSQDDSHLFIYNFGYIIDFDVNFKSFQILNYNYNNNNNYDYSHNLFSINSSLWQIKVSPTIDSNSTFLIELFNLQSNFTTSFDIVVPSLNTHTNSNFIYSYISSDLSNLFFEVQSNDNTCGSTGCSLQTVNHMYVKLHNFQQQEIVRTKVDKFAYDLGWATNESALYLYRYIKNSKYNISVFDFKTMNFKSYNLNNTGALFLDSTGKYLAIGRNVYQINSDSITLISRITEDIPNSITWGDSMSKYKIENKIFNYNKETQGSKRAFTINTNMFTEEELVFSNLFLMNLLLLVVFPLSMIIYNKRMLIKERTLQLYKSAFNTD